MRFHATWPVASLQAAQQAIATAERDDAGHSAPGELGDARSKLAAANVAVTNEQMTSAHRLALESRAAAYNQDLSLRRAESVLGYIAARGVASTRMTSVGKGEAQPVASNESAAGRQQNRRVEIVIGNDLPATVSSR